jgi:hypothetical protein
MKRFTASRGAALPETALVLTATLSLFFGIIQIGAIGYLQLMVDGAAFVAAHEYALGNTAYLTWAQRPFPLIGTPDIDQNAPADTTVPVNYNTSQTRARQGGVSLVRSSRLQATVQRNAPTGLLGVGIASLSGVDIHGSAIEPKNLVSNTEYDVNADGYGGASSQLNYYGNVQNAPYNYISMQIMQYCIAPSFQVTCSSTGLRSLGSAEFLDHDNWNRTTLGVGSYSSSYTFGEMLCHQAMYASAASNIFVSATTNGNLPTPDPNSTSNTVGQIYSWDKLDNNGGETLSESNYGQYPLHPGNGCS